jgi:hypothetical protein
MTLSIGCLVFAVSALAYGLYWLETRVNAMLGAMRAVDKQNSILTVQVQLHHRRISELEREACRTTIIVPKVVGE